jgi:hypothetical protein
MGNPRQRRRQMSHVGGSKMRKSKHKAIQPANLTRRVTIGMEAVRERWDRTKTLKENMTALGLARDANLSVPGPANPANPVNAVRLHLELTGDAAAPPPPPSAADAGKPKPLIAELEHMAASATPRIAYVPEGELLLVKNLVDKYGVDFKAWSRDHEINYNQHTPKQLEQKYKRAQQTIQTAKELGSIPQDFEL